MIELLEGKQPNTLCLRSIILHTTLLMQCPTAILMLMKSRSRSLDICKNVNFPWIFMHAIFCWQTTSYMQDMLVDFFILRKVRMSFEQVQIAPITLVVRIRLYISFYSLQSVILSYGLHAHQVGVGIAVQFWHARMYALIFLTTAIWIHVFPCTLYANPFW